MTVITAKGESKMIAEQVEANKSTKKRVGKPKSKKTPASKKPTKAADKTKSREGSKTATLLALLHRKDGATTAELLKVSGWQPHSLRGFLSGTVKKKMGLTVVSSKREDGGRSYSISA